MKIYQNGKELHLSNLVNEYKKQLKNNKVVKIFSDNSAEHIACYLAWKEVGGVIFVQPTNIPFYTDQFELIELPKFLHKSYNIHCQRNRLILLA